VPHIQVNLVGQLDYLVVPLGVDEARFEVVIEETIWTQVFDMSLDEVFESLLNYAELSHVLLECQAGAYLFEDK